MTHLDKKYTVLTICVLYLLTCVCFPGRALAQSTVQPESSITLYAYCVNQAGAVIPNCTVSLANSYYYATGGHNHTNTRTASQYGTLSNTGGFYYGYSGWQVTFTAKRVAGWEYVAACAYYCSTHDVLVAYPDISAYFGHATNVFIGSTGTHPSNHWGAPVLNNAVTAITQQYHAEFSCRSNYQIVGVNDMALPNGGVFDYQATWIPPHNYHDRGRSVDFRARSGVSNSVIYEAAVLDRFLQVCRERGLNYAIRESIGTDNEHIHCSTSWNGL